MRTLYGIAFLAATVTWMAPVASAEPAGPSPTAPDCTTVAGGTYTGTSTTECQTPGNVEIAESAPAPEYPFPWGDEFYGPEFGIGGGDRR